MTTEKERSLTSEEIFGSKGKKGQISEVWRDAERGEDPLIEYWKDRKRKASFCEREKHK